MFWILFGWSWDVWNIPLVTKPPWSSCRERLAGAKRKKPMTSHPKSDQRIQQDGKLMCLLPSLRRKIAFTLQTSCLSIRQYSNIRATILAPHQEFIISPTHRKNMVWVLLSSIWKAYLHNFCTETIYLNWASRTFKLISFVHFSGTMRYLSPYLRYTPQRPRLYLYSLHYGKLTWQWNVDLLKMYSRLKIGKFHCCVSLLKDIIYI